MTRHKHVPQRTCVVCRKKSDKQTFTRLAKTDNGVMLDSSGRLGGRGAYICDDVACWKQAAQTDIIGKALRIRLTDADRLRIRQRVS